MHKKMFSYLHISKMKWFDLYTSLLNSHVSYFYWAL